MSSRSFIPCLAFLIFIVSSDAEVSQSPAQSPLDSSARMPIRASLIRFRDVTQRVGIQQPEMAEQFGGATIADIDGDGHYDMILSFHNRHPTLFFFGTPSGTFIRSPFEVRGDIHGISVVPRSARSPDKIIAVTIGGGRGTNPQTSLMYLTGSDRSFTDIRFDLGFGQQGSRGRTAVAMDMTLNTRRQRRANLGGPDLLFINLLGVNTNLTHFAYENVRGNYSLQQVPGLAMVNEERAIVTDIDGDGVMELIHFSVLRIFRLVAPFTFEESTRQFWPGERPLGRSISAVVELDYNNDGLMDLYIARAPSGFVTPRGPRSVPEISDVLLMNQGGTYVDVSSSAGIPSDSASMGVTAEDFDNNGFVDLLIAVFNGPDILLLNRGDGRFTSLNPRTAKPARARGANVMAMDYDLDGRVDYIVQHGHRTQFLGNFRLMRNLMRLGRENNYLHVRVGNEPSRATTRLHALVTLFLPRGQRQVRRVGGRGARAGSESLIDTVHFGLGSLTRVSRVTVVWTTRVSQAMTRVRANRMISFGRFN